MNAAIFLRDSIQGGESKPVENFTFDIDKDGLKTVQSRLIELQKGYCEVGDAKPRIQLAEVPSKKTPGKMIKVIYATSAVDFYYIAYVGMIINTLPK